MSLSNPTPFTLLAPALLNIENRELWLRGDDDAHLTVATGVSAWADTTGNGRALVQAVGAKQPVKVAAALNGLQGIRFDGVDDTLAMAWPAGAQLNAGSSCYLVVDVRFAIPSAVLGRPLIRMPNSNAVGLQYEPTSDGNAPSRDRLEAFASTNVGLKRATPAAQATPGPRLISLIATPTTLTLYKNRVQEAAVGGFTSLVSTVGDTFNLCFDTAASYGTYDVFELLVFSRSHVASEQSVVESVLATRWGL